jgi:hypothetical protein
MDLARLPETSPQIDDRLAALADPELADRLADVHPSLFPTAPPHTERAVLTWTARRFGVAAVALTAVASAAVGYLFTTSATEKAQPKAQALVPAPVAVPKSARVAPHKATAAVVAHQPAAHAHPVVATHVVPVAAPVAHVAAPVLAPVAAVAVPVVHRAAAPAVAHDDAQAAEAARLRARVAADNAEIARLRARELAQTEAARAERIRAAQAIQSARTAQVAHESTVAAPSADVSSADARQAKTDAAMQQGVNAAHAALPQSANAGSPAAAGGADPSAAQGSATGTGPNTTAPQNPQGPTQGGHHGGFGFPFPVGGPVDSCSPNGGRLSVSQILIEGVLRSVSHGSL